MSMRNFTFTPGQVKATGWVGFTFEGAMVHGFLFKCNACKTEFTVPANHNPNHHHACVGSIAAARDAHVPDPAIPYVTSRA